MTIYETFEIVSLEFGSKFVINCLTIPVVFSVSLIAVKQEKDIQD